MNAKFHHNSDLKVMRDDESAVTSFELRRMDEK